MSCASHVIHHMYVNACFIIDKEVDNEPIIIGINAQEFPRFILTRSAK